MKTRILLLISAIVGMIWLISWAPSKPTALLVHSTQKAQKQVAENLLQLEQLLSPKTIDWVAVEAEFIQARLAFKRTETVLWYADREFVNRHINGAPLPKLEPGAPTASILQPTGLQRLEETIAERDAPASRALVHHLQNQWELLSAQTQNIRFSDRMTLEAVRQEILRIALMHVTGFENPAFTAPIKEAHVAWASILPVVQTMAASVKNDSLKGIIQNALDTGAAQLAHADFNHFNRATFIRTAAQPLYGALIVLQGETHIEWHSETSALPMAVREKAKNIFSADFYNTYFFTAFTPEKNTPEMRELGRYLFFDPQLSGNNQRACASCHNPKKAFTDGHKKSLAFDHQGTVNRNSPGLINAVFSPNYFYDLRTQQLENQFEHVVFSDKEFKSSYAEIEYRLQNSSEYKTLFAEAFQHENGHISKYTITTALAVYVASLQSFNSPIDQYLRNENGAKISADEEAGFNLFMGKANCGTCHFAPTFAGLVPPFYDEAESEILGVPATVSSKKIDPDLGRSAGVIKQSVPIYNHSFKTTTVRNVALTAPYMHNGVYDSLLQVIDFYNAGGGQGFGFEVPFQTLPPDSLKLSALEKNQIIAFLRALTDTSGMTVAPKRLPKMNDVKLDARAIGGEY